MQSKSYEILLDIKQGLMNNQIIEVVTGDYGMNNFKFKLLRDRLVPYDLTNTIVRIMAVTPSGSKQQQDCIIENYKGGTVDLTLKQSLFIEPGGHIAELQVYDKDTQVLRVTFPRFRYYVKQSLQDDETIQASDEYSILQQMIVDVGDINNNINTKVGIHNEDEESHQDIRNLIGELASLTTDQRANLVAAINEVKSYTNDIATNSTSEKTPSTYAKRDINGRIKVETMLHNVTNQPLVVTEYLNSPYGAGNSVKSETVIRSGQGLWLVNISCGTGPTTANVGCYLVKMQSTGKVVTPIVAVAGISVELDSTGLGIGFAKVLITNTSGNKSIDVSLIKVGA